MSYDLELPDYIVDELDRIGALKKSDWIIEARLAIETHIVKFKAEQEGK